MKAADLPLYYNMCEILEHNLKARADKTALNSNDGSLTFGEVSSQVNQIGNALLRSGIQFGDCVAVLCPDRSEWVSSFFAVAKIGGITLAMRGRVTTVVCATPVISLKSPRRGSSVSLTYLRH